MSSSYIWICLNLCMPLEFDMPDCHECKWTALPKPINTIGIHPKLQLQAGKCKHLSPPACSCSLSLFPRFILHSASRITPPLLLYQLLFHTLYHDHCRSLTNTIMPFRYHLISSGWALCLSAFRRSYLIIPKLNQPTSSALRYRKPKCGVFDQGVFSLASAGFVMWRTMSKW